jgi:hypothetical protein
MAVRKIVVPAAWKAASNEVVKLHRFLERYRRSSEG